MSAHHSPQLWEKIRSSASYSSPRVPALPCASLNSEGSQGAWKHGFLFTSSSRCGTCKGASEPRVHSLIPPGAGPAALASLHHCSAPKIPGAQQLSKTRTGHKRKYIIEVAQSTAQKFLLAGEPGKAIPAGLQALRFSLRVYGAGSVHVVPAYLLLAEACMDADCLMQATTYLSQAQWLVLKSPACSLAVQHKLQRDLGLLYAAKGDLEQSLYHLANDVYLASCAFGPDAVQAAEGYFHMAKIFLRQNKTDVADSLFAEVTASWHAFLLKSVQTQEQILKAQAEASPFDEDRDVSEEPLTEAQQTEAIQALNTILDFREKAPKQQPDGAAKVLHSLAMLYYLKRDLSQAREMGAKALDLMKQLPQQESLEAVDHLLNLINSKPFCGK